MLATPRAEFDEEAAVMALIKPESFAYEHQLGEDLTSSGCSTTFMSVWKSAGEYLTPLA
jgi:hypothetical protein